MQHFYNNASNLANMQFNLIVFTVHSIVSSFPVSFSRLVVVLILHSVLHLLKLGMTPCNEVLEEAVECDVMKIAIEENYFKLLSFQKQWTNLLYFFTN